MSLDCLFLLFNVLEASVTISEGFKSRMIKFGTDR